jgi:hypothetical protein
MLHPWCEVTQLAIISVISQPHLRSNEKDLVVVNNYATVIDYVLMNNGPGDVWVYFQCYKYYKLTFRCRTQCP